MTAPTTKEEAALNLPVGEMLSVPERVIVSPGTGIFRRPGGQLQLNSGDLVNHGDPIGIVQSLGVTTPIRSPFEGSLVAMLASEGERVRLGQAVAWLRVSNKQGTSTRP